MTRTLGVAPVQRADADHRSVEIVGYGSESAFSNAFKREMRCQQR